MEEAADPKRVFHKGTPGRHAHVPHRRAHTHTLHPHEAADRQAGEHARAGAPLAQPPHVCCADNTSSSRVKEKKDKNSEARSKRGDSDERLGPNLSRQSYVRQPPDPFLLRRCGHPETPDTCVGTRRPTGCSSRHPKKRKKKHHLWCAHFYACATRNR